MANPTMVPAQEATRLTWANNHLPSCGMTSPSQANTDSEILFTIAASFLDVVAVTRLVAAASFVAGAGVTTSVALVACCRCGKNRSRHSSRNGRRDIHSEIRSEERRVGKECRS